MFIMFIAPCWEKRWMVRGRMGAPGKMNSNLGFLGTFWAEEEFLSPAWTTKRS